MQDDPLAAPCAVGEGTGTALAVLPPVDAHVLLAKPPLGVSTAAAYKGVDAFLEGDQDTRLADDAAARQAVPGVSRIHPDIDGIILALNKHDLFSAVGKLGNTLELYTLKRYHEVVYTKCKIQEHVRSGAALMSGSGPTVFLLTPDVQEAEAAYEALAEDELTRILTRTVV
jgi:4-diphosphocytidyl-2-C-methyl-D-erythritol kinase